MVDKKQDNTLKPRTTNLTLDFGRPVTFNGFYFDPKTGEAKLLYNGINIEPESASVETGYGREKGLKILTRSSSDPSSLIANPNRYLERFYSIFAVDTNTKSVGESTVSVTGVVLGQNTRVKIPNHTSIRFRPVICLEFWDASESPERMGWRNVVEAIIGAPTYSASLAIALVVDSDLGMLPQFNRRTKPIVDDFYLPENFELIYASSDVGKENIANKMISLADKSAAKILNKVTTAAPKGDRSGVRAWHPTKRPPA